MKKGENEENKEEKGKMRKMKTKEFDYYIFIDYSENLIGYNIIEKVKIKELLSKINKFDHYRGVKNKKLYLKAIKPRFEKENITQTLFKWKIRELRFNLEIFSDVIRFIKENDNCFLFLSIDDNQYKSFINLIKILSINNLKILKESEINKKSLEYRLSLIIDNMLNLERYKRLNNKQ